MIDALVDDVSRPYTEKQRIIKKYGLDKNLDC